MSKIIGHAEEKPLFDIQNYWQIEDVIKVTGLARKVGGGLDVVVAMTGHKDFKLADHYSKLDGEFQRDISEKIMKNFRQTKGKHEDTFENVLKFGRV